MNETSPFMVIVRFATSAEEQAVALAEIGAYVESFLRLQPGFCSSELLQNEAGAGVTHVARWRSEADFKAFAARARSHPALPALRRFAPDAQFYRVWQRYQPPPA